MDFGEKIKHAKSNTSLILEKIKRAKTAKARDLVRIRANCSLEGIS